jgi:SAM-dependent methyltransferase
MNIADKERLYAEIRRVLRPGGRLAMHEFLAGPLSPIHFSVPWARNPGLNHLRPAEEVRALIQDTGFEELTWIDETDPALRRPPEAARGDARTTIAARPPLVLGDALGEMLRHQACNLAERRISSVQAVFKRP